MRALWLWEEVRRSATALPYDALEPSAEPRLRIRVRGALLPGEVPYQLLADLAGIPRNLMEL